MTEREAEEVKPIWETRQQQTEDEASTSMKTSRWDALLRAATGHINARDSPLLRLPPELRNRIYGYVLGHMYIYPNAAQPHRTPSPYPPLLVCDCDGARDQKAHGRHTACWPQRLYYHLLCTCRQIYTEAFPLLWSTNTFCFENSAVMLLVIQKWLPHQKALIKNVRLDINWFALNGEWKTHLKAANLASLPGLKQIHIVTHTDVEPSPLMARLQRRKSRLVKLVYEMLARRPDLTMFVVRDGRFYRRLVSKTRLGKLLERV